MIHAEYRTEVKLTQYFFFYCIFVIKSSVSTLVLSSSNMQQAISKKLMVSLCGLALSSVFLINNKSVVHADTVSDDQNNAISWNSDSDAAQNVQNTRKADDDQQNVQSVQPSRAETSTVRSSLAAPRTTNQSAAVQLPKISNINDAQAAVPVVINNPAGDKVHVHYIDSNGNAVENSAYDYDIDATKTGQGQYNAPTDSKGNKYQLNYPDGKYTVSGGAFNGTNLHASISPVAPTYEQHLSTGNAVDDKILQDHGALDLANKIETDYTTETVGSYTGPMKIVATQITGTDTAYYKPDNQYSWSTMPEPIYGSFGSTGGYENWSTDKVMSDSELDSMYSQGSDKVVQYMSVQTKPGYTNQTLPVAFVDSNNNIVGMIQNYSGKVGTTQNVSLTVPTGYKLADGQSLPTSVTFADNNKAQLIKVVPSGENNSVQANKVHVKFVDQSTGQEVAGGYDITLSDTDTKSGVYNIPAGYGTLHNTYGVNAVIGGVVFNQPDDPNGQPAFYVNDTDATKSSIAKKLINYYYNYWLKSDPSWANDMFFIHKNATGNEAEYPDYSGYLSLKDGTWDKHDVGFTSHELNYLNDVATPNVNRKGISVHYTYGKPRFEDDYNMITSATGNDPVIVTVPVHQSKTFMFTDNSGNAKSAQGNTVDVTLTKPQSVNPAMDTRCQSQATRTIQINFPDGQIPEAYDGIVDKSGKLVQTVHFTRTATEDALTSTILSYGNWTSDNQDPNFIGFPERTLPRIPGYTLSIKPA